MFTLTEALSSGMICLVVLLTMSFIYKKIKDYEDFHKRVLRETERLKNYKMVFKDILNVYKENEKDRDFHSRNLNMISTILTENFIRISGKELSLQLYKENASKYIDGLKKEISKEKDPVKLKRMLDKISDLAFKRYGVIVSFNNINNSFSVSIKSQFKTINESIGIIEKQPPKKHTFKPGTPIVKTGILISDLELTIGKMLPSENVLKVA